MVHYMIDQVSNVSSRISYKSVIVHATSTIIIIGLFGIIWLFQCCVYLSYECKMVVRALREHRQYIHIAQLSHFIELEQIC